MGMRAIGKAAVPGQTKDGIKGDINAIGRIGKANLAHTGVIDEKPATIESYQLAVAGNVPATVRLLTNGTGFHHGTPGKRVDQRRFAHPRRTKHAIGLSRFHRRLERLVPGAGRVADGHDRHVGDSLPYAFDDPGRFPGVDQIDLGQDNDWGNPRGVAERQVTFQPIEIEVAVGGLNDECVIDIGRDELRFAKLPDRTPGKGRKTRKNAMDDGEINVTDSQRNPVTDGREVCAPRGRKTQVAGNLGIVLGRLRPDDVALLVFGNNPTDGKILPAQFDRDFPLAPFSNGSH